MRCVHGIWLKVARKTWHFSVIFLCYKEKYSFLYCALNVFTVHLQNHAADMARRINIRNENMLTAQQYQRRASENSE